MSANHSFAAMAATHRRSTVLHLKHSPLKFAPLSFSTWTRTLINGSLFSLLQHSNMPPKGKVKKGNVAAQAVTPTKRSKRPAHKSQPAPVYFPSVGEDQCHLDKTLGSPAETVDSGLSGVMDMLIDIFGWLQATDQFIEEVKLDRATEVAWRQESPSHS